MLRLSLRPLEPVGMNCTCRERGGRGLTAPINAAVELRQDNSFAEIA